MHRAVITHIYGPSLELSFAGGQKGRVLEYAVATVRPSDSLQVRIIHYSWKSYLCEPIKA